MVSTHGILLLDKPLGLTSNQALGKAKRMLGIRKAGHTGALDPMATGLLPLCFGEATKVSAFLLEADKAYLAELKLGQTTASGDVEGDIEQTRPVPELDRERLEEVLEKFRGEIDQVPPMYSALKHQGRRLHELARQGVEVERKPRRITIRRLELLDFGPDRLTLRVDCTKGTYIRSLAMDIGETLGCGAHLSALRRTASGPFRLEDAVGFEKLESLDADQARGLLLPPDQALAHLPELRLDTASTEDIRNGRRASVPEAPESGLLRLYSGNVFLGIGQVTGPREVRAKRLFNPP